MAEIVKMPKLSDTMTEGVVAKWHKEIGDEVESGELLAEIETDKATMEFESFQDGVLLYKGVEEGKSAPVDGLLAIFGEKGESYEHLLNEESSQSNGESKEAKEDKKEEKPASDKKTEKIDTSGIAANIIRMPKLSDTMTEGTVAKWHKKVGDKVESGDLLAEIETDKATMEFESFDDGTLLMLGVEEGQSAEVDSILAIVGEKGADYETLVKADQQKQSEPALAEVNEKSEAQASKTTQEKATPPTPTPVFSGNVSGSSNGRIKASPLAKKLAEERNISLSQINGSGDGGRIIKRDIENFTPSTGATPGLTSEQFEDVEVSQMRKTIARRLSESKFNAPHFYLTISLDMDQAIAARNAINEGDTKVSFNDMVIKAAAAALAKHPEVNAAWYGDHIRMNKHVNIGVAVAVDEGLLVPVVRYANTKSFAQINSEVKDFAQKAKTKKLQPQDWEGNTFTISNLGMFGIDEFTAIINPPDACIMAVGTINQVPVVKEGKIVPGNVMKVTLSCDHRVVDGAKGAQFLQTFKRYMENPITMFV